MHLLLILSLAAQGSRVTSTSTPDVNGRAVEGPTVTESLSKDGYEKTEKLRSVNGNLVPRLRVEERVLRDDASGRMVERTVRRFDPNGNPGPLEKTVIEEEKRPGGATIRTTTYRGDLNGNMAPAERSLTETRKSASGETSETVIERPSLQGGLEAVEKQTKVQVGSPGQYEANTVIYRKGGSGFYAAVKQVTNHSEAAGRAQDDTAEYEMGSTGNLELHSQTVTRTSKSAAGAVTSEVDRFERFVPGEAASTGSGLRLRERETTELKTGPGGQTVETVTVRQPTGSDPNVLGPAKMVSETVCRGKCQ